MLRRTIPDVVHDQDLLTIGARENVRTAARRMAERKVRSILVVGDTGLEGIFTGTDMVERVVAAGLNPEQTPIDAVMTRDPETIAHDALAIEALRQMQEGGYRHLPVVEQGRLVGIVSRKDFRHDEEMEIEQEQQLWEHL